VFAPLGINIQWNYPVRDMTRGRELRKIIEKKPTGEGP